MGLKTKNKKNPLQTYLSSAFDYIKRTHRSVCSTTSENTAHHTFEIIREIVSILDHLFLAIVCYLFF